MAVGSTPRPSQCTRPRKPPTLLALIFIPPKLRRVLRNGRHATRALVPRVAALSSSLGGATRVGTAVRD
jgi:hypothetical protein